MKVREAFRPATAFAVPSDSLRDAARKMRGSGQGCLPVLEGDSVLGIITERDLVQAVAGGVGAESARVADYTSDGSITVSLGDECEVAGLKMLAIGCRNLPVVDGDGKLVGTISMRDVILRSGRADRPSAARPDGTAHRAIGAIR